MPPKFSESSFLFPEGVPVPEHVEEFPRLQSRDFDKWYLEGYDTFSDEPYPLAIDLDSVEDAMVLAAARLRHLEVTQPSLDSGGQEDNGIQDRVYIIPPRMSEGRRINISRDVLFGGSPENPDHQE